jgi:hypothetical protein
MTTEYFVGLINFIIGVMALPALAITLDRLRMSSWREGPKSIVLMHILLSITLGGIAFAGIVDHSIVSDMGFSDDLDVLYHVTATLMGYAWLSITAPMTDYQPGAHPHRRKEDAAWADLHDKHDGHRPV